MIKSLIAIFALFLSTVSLGGELVFTAAADREELSIEDSISVKFTVKSDESTSIESISYTAPGLQAINEFNSTYIESFYENGRFGVRNTQSVTKVFKPLRTGTLKLENIKLLAGGKTYNTPPISIVVLPGGAGTPPPKGYGGAGMGLRGVGKKVSSAGFFVRAEIDKQKAFKGEQVIVSYYLYQRVRTFNIMVEKYPILTGFLREELDMPVVNQRLDGEQVVLDGTPYTRSLLARYAAYPLKEGKLPIDPISIKATYYGGSRSANDDDDDPFMSFFQTMAPRVGTSRSDKISIEVAPLPDTAKPASFSGGVGQFEVNAAVDKTEIRANEAVTLTLRVEGKGNLSSIQEPKVTWPENVELYESKADTKASASGFGQKSFEFLLIPRLPGKIQLPSIEMSFFDPQSGSYVSKNTAPIEISVGDPVAGTQITFPARQKQQNNNVLQNGQVIRQEIRSLKPPGEEISSFNGHPWWRWLYWLTFCSFAVFSGLVIIDKSKKRLELERSTREERSLALSKSWQRLEERGKAATKKATWIEITQSYELLSGAVYDAIDSVYQIGARSLSRSDLKSILVDDRGLAEEIWVRIDRLLDFAETVRFASSAGAVTENAAREGLLNWVKEGRNINSSLAKLKKKQ